jgi:HEPN domain-containing protein
MSDLPPEHHESKRWRQEAHEELRTAELLAGHGEIPERVIGFHAHLAAEKALKSLLIERGVIVPRLHDLIELQSLLPHTDADRFSVAGLELLNPWAIEGRYPSDSDASEQEVREVLAAAARVVATVADLTA